MAEITLNSKRYSGDFIDRQTAEAFAQVIRRQGLSQQIDLQSPDSKVFGPLTGGFGRSRIPSHLSSDPAQYLRFFDSRCETRFGTTYLAILNEDSGNSGLEVMRASTVYKGNLWALWGAANSTSSVTSEALRWRYYDGSSTEWAGGTESNLSDPIIGLDLISHKDKMVTLSAYQNDHRAYHSTDGSTWTVSGTPITVNLLSNNVTANEDINAGMLASIGNELVAVVWHEANGTITFFSSTDSGTAWADEAVDIGSGNGPLGVAVYPGIDDADKLYVLTVEGLYEVDTSPGTWTIHQTELRNSAGGDDFNCRRLVVHEGKLWIALGTSTSAPVKIATMDTSGGTRLFNINMGLNVLDGVPSDMLGGVHWMKSVEDMLYITVGGEAANRNGRILCYTGTDVNGFPQWHHMFRNSTANQEVQWIDFSTRDDGNARLHFAMRTAAATSDTEFLADPNTNPASGISGKTQASGIIDYPFMDGGMPTIPGIILQLRADARSLSASTSGEYIAASYGVNEEARTANTNLTNSANFESDDLDLDVASGAGLAGRSFGVRLTLNRDSGDTTHTPKLGSLEIDYMKVPSLRKRFLFEVDLEKTARLPGHSSTEQVIANINAAEALTVLPALSYSRDATTYVKVTRVDDVFKLREGSGPSLRRRSGTSLIHMEEPL